MGLEALPLREELEALVHHYYHLQQEHERANLDSAVRRRIEDRLLQVRERFDRLLEEWVPDEELREAWRRYIHHHGPPPDGPESIPRLVFRGVSEVSGSVVEVRGKGDELRMEVDGSLVERIAGEGDFAAGHFRRNHTEYHEVFAASEEALEALADFYEHGGPPPWEHASELLADGLIDVHFELTRRGRRALAAREA
jgi:hypothetical protein